MHQVSIYRCLPAPVLSAISEEVAENPGFVGEYLVPVLEFYEDPCAAVISHLSEALAEDQDVALYGLAGLGALGRSPKKAIKKAVKKVAAVHKAVAKKAVEAVKRVGPAKLLTAGAVGSRVLSMKPIAKAVKRTGQFVKRAADTKVARAIAAPFTFGLSTKRGMERLRKARDSKYAEPAVMATGLVFSGVTGGLSLAAAGIATAALRAKRAKQAAEAAKAAGRSDAAAVSAEASTLESQASSQIDDFYRANQAALESWGVTPSSWYSMTLEQKTELLRQIGDGTYKPPGGTSASDRGAAPPGGGGGYTSSGGGGYAPPPTGIPSEGGGEGGGSWESGGGLPPPGGPAPIDGDGKKTPVQAGLLGGTSPWMLAAMAGGLILSFMQEKKGGRRRARRNPSRRRRWRRSA